MGPLAIARGLRAPIVWGGGATASKKAARDEISQAADSTRDSALDASQASPHFILLILHLGLGRRVNPSGGLCLFLGPKRDGLLSFLLQAVLFQLVIASSDLVGRQHLGSLHSTGGVAAELQTLELFRGCTQIIAERGVEQLGQPLFLIAGDQFEASDEHALDLLGLGRDFQRNHGVGHTLRENRKDARSRLGEPQVVPGGDHRLCFCLSQSLGAQGPHHVFAENLGHFFGWDPMAQGS